MATYAVPSCSRDVEIYEPEPSVVSALTVCFCCLASETPVINAISCAHTAFVQQYFTEWSNQNLAICFTCHYMLEKIEIFRRQVRESLELLSDYQHTKEQNLNRPRLVNHLVTSDVVVDVIEDVRIPFQPPVHINNDKAPGSSKMATEYSDNESVERIEIATDRIKPVAVILEDKQKIKKKEKPQIKNRNKMKDKSNQKSTQQKVTTKKNGSLRKTTKTNVDTDESNLLIERPNKKTGSRKRPISPNPSIEKPKKKVSWQKNPIPPSPTSKKKDVTITSKITPPAILRWHKYKLSQESKKNSSYSNQNMDTKKVDISNMQDLDTFCKKYDGLIKVSYLTPEELKNERETERQSTSYLKSKFKCITCIRGFTNETRYTSHKIRFHPNIRTDFLTTCGICDVVIKSKEGVTAHLQYHIMRFVCVICGLVSRVQEKSESHYKSFHELSIHCKDCNKTFSKRKHLLIHRSKNHKKKCHLCEQKIQDRSDLFIHYRKFHPDVRTLVCKHCPATFKHYNELTLHRQNVHNIQRNDNTNNKLINEGGIAIDNEIYGIVNEPVVKIEKSGHNYVVQMEKSSHNNVVQMEKSSRNNVGQMKKISSNNVGQMKKISSNNVGQMEKISHNNVGQMEKSSHNNVVQMEESSHNYVVQMEKSSRNNVGQMKKISSNNVGQMEKSNHNNVVEIENIGQVNVVEMENIGHYNVVSMDDIGQDNIVIEMLNIDHDNVALMDNIGHDNVVLMDNIGHDNVIEMLDISQNNVEIVNNPSNLYISQNDSNLSEGCISNVDNEQNIVVIENIGDILTFENNVSDMQNIPNTVEMVNNDRTVVELVNNDQHIIELDNDDHNTVGLVNNDLNIVESANNNQNIVESANEDQNIVESANDKHNTIGLVNDDQNIRELGNDDQNTVELVNNDQNIVELPNDDQNSVKLVNNDQNIVELVNNEQNMIELDNDDHEIVKLENNNQTIEKSVNNNENIKELVTEDQNIVDLGNNKDLNNMNQDNKCIVMDGGIL